MRAALVAAALGLLLCALPGCRSGLLPPGIHDGPTAADAAADRAIVQADSDLTRKLRAAGVCAIISELMADRIRDDIAEAPRALAQVERFHVLASRLRALDTIWLETELYQLRESVNLAFGGVVRARVMFYLAQKAAPDPAAILAQVTSALRHSAKAAAMIADLNRQFDALAAGALAEDRLWAGLLGRLEHNRQRIEAATKIN